MHIITKIFDNIKYLTNEKNEKLKKNENENKAQNFFHMNHPDQKTKKNEHC